MENLRKAKDYFREKHEKDPEYKKAWEEVEPEYELAREIIKARRRLNLTQQEVARKIKTSQSVISRLENGKGISFETIKSVAKALNCRPRIILEPVAMDSEKLYKEKA